MTELLGFAALAVGGYWVVNRMKKKIAEVERRLSEAAAAAKGPNGEPVRTLKQDPETGRYRPEQ